MAYLHINDDNSQADNREVEENVTQTGAKGGLNLRTKASCAVVAVALLSVTAVAFSLVRPPRAYEDGLAGHDFQTLYSALKVDREHIEPMNFSAIASAGFSKDHIEAARALGLIHTDIHVAQLRVAVCAIDATHAAYFLSRAALAITAATETCQDVEGKGPHQKAACAADISSVVASVGFVAQYLSEAVLMCQQTMFTNMKARCAAGVSGIIANTARVANQASFMAGNCNGAAAYDQANDNHVWQMSRRLAGIDVAAMQTATCSIDVGQAATYLAQFGAWIDGATLACGQSKYKMDKTFHPKTREAYRVQCAMNVFDVLEGVFMAGSFISSAVSQCAPATNQQALCASGAVGLNGAIAGMVQSSLQVYKACSEHPLLSQATDPYWRSAKKATAWNNAAGRRRKIPFVR